MPEGEELRITWRLSVAGGEVQEPTESRLEKPRGEWIELNLGRFRASEGEHGEGCFDLWEHGGHWKNSLLVQGAIIRPCN